MDAEALREDLAAQQAGLEAKTRRLKESEAAQAAAARERAERLAAAEAEAAARAAAGAAALKVRGMSEAGLLSCRCVV